VLDEKRVIFFFSFFLYYSVDVVFSFYVDHFRRVFCSFSFLLQYNRGREQKKKLHKKKH